MKNNIFGKQKRMYSLIFLALLGISVSYVLTVGYAVPAPAEGGLSITVKFKGTPPAPPALRTAKAKSLCGVENIANEALVIGKGNEIKNVLLYIKGAQGTVQKKDYSLVNKDCVFHPHVGFAAVGSKLVISNEDEVLHNTHGYLVLGKAMKKTILNIALPKGSKPVANDRALSKTGLVEMNCDAHEWMFGRIMVVDNPYYAISDAAGKAEIKNMPAGEYELMIYHETLGEFTKKVKVTAGQTTDVPVEFQ